MKTVSKLNLKTLKGLATFAGATAFSVWTNAAVIEEIIVTAQKRAQNVQDVPMSISAFTNDFLEKVGVNNIKELASVTPGLVLQERASSLNPYIRGIGTDSATIGNDSPVTIYVDGVLFNEKRMGSFLEFLDLERIEVLKGPQGTLFGRNSTGGAINIITSDPSEVPTAKAEGTYGKYADMTAKLYLAGPLTDTLAASVSISRSKTDGYLNNSNPNSGFSDKDIGGMESDDFRVKLKLDISENFTARFSAEKTNENNAGGASWLPFSEVKTVADAILGSPVSRQSWDYSGNAKSLSDLNSESASMTLDWVTPFADIKSITAYRNVNTDTIIDVDVSPVPVLDLRSFGFQDFWSQELQMTSNAEGRLKWVTGLYYLDQNTGYGPQNIYSGIAWPYSPVDVAASAAGGYASDYTGATTESIAAYVEMTYDLTDSTALTLGARYTEEEVDLRDDRIGYFITPNATLDGFVSTVRIANRPSIGETYREPTWTVILDHSFSEDAMGYLSYKRGYKSGIFNLASLGSAGEDPTEPEIIDAYEAGFKSILMDGGLRLNGSVFFYDYQDLQVQVTNLDAGGLQATENAAAAEILGLELSGDWVLTDRLTLTVGLSVLDTEYTEYSNATIFEPRPTGGLANAVADLSGAPLPFTPDYTTNVALSYDIPLEDGSRLVLSGNWLHSDEFELVHTYPVVQDAYDKINLSASWYSASDTYYVKLWGNNVLDEEIRAGVSTNALGHAGYYYPPLTFGVTAGATFEM